MTETQERIKSLDKKIVTCYSCYTNGEIVRPCFGIWRGIDEKPYKNDEKGGNKDSPNALCITPQKMAHFEKMEIHLLVKIFRLWV